MLPSLRLRIAALSLLIVCVSTPVASPAASDRKVLAIGVDYADMIYHGYLGGYLYNAEKIRNLMQMLKEGGMDEVYWRVSAVGLVTYPSKVMTVMDGSRLTDRGFSPAGVIMKQCDPLAVAIEEAHKQGLKLYVYITL